ncbi:MAG: ATPase, T2SS/T4P/T4SS family [Candidatus Melainabacteria bacterium]|nr:ATPase, T2SS/T4P/T4SS family [Candidatus Melainabacteria bacterium]
MLDTTLERINIYGSELYSEQNLGYKHLERALNYRKLLYPVIDDYLNPQNLSLEAKNLQDQLNQIKTKDLYAGKAAKAQILDGFIEQIFKSPRTYGIALEQAPSINDKLWTKTLLVDDFIYYGPTTILSLCPILKSSVELEANPLYAFLKQTVDPAQVTEIRVNNHKDIYYEAVNKIHSWPIPFLSEAQLITIIERIVSESNLLHQANIAINTASPIADFEHPCGYIRASALIPPVAESAFLTLRIHPGEPYVLEDLVNFGMLSLQMQEFLMAIQAAGTTIAIAGTMGSGKTTLLSALSEHWPADAGRKATIEDTPELRPRIADLIKMRTIESEREDIRDVDVTRLTKACKRHSVRYVVLSEARDGAAWEILQLSQAILGTLMTFHYTLRSNKYLVDQALNTLVALCKQHPLAPAGDDIKHLVADMVQILILVEQSPIDNIRRLIKIYYVTGFDSMNGGHFKFVELFSYDAEQGFHQVNICSEFEDYLKLKGVDYKF